MKIADKKYIRAVKIMYYSDNRYAVYVMIGHDWEIVYIGSEENCQKELKRIEKEYNLFDV
jgi:hypothetical protein